MDCYREVRAPVDYQIIAGDKPKKEEEKKLTVMKEYFFSLPYPTKISKLRQNEKEELK